MPRYQIERATFRPVITDATKMAPNSNMLPALVELRHNCTLGEGAVWCPHNGGRLLWVDIKRYI